MSLQILVPGFAAVAVAVLLIRSRALFRPRKTNFTLTLSDPGLPAEDNGQAQLLSRVRLLAEQAAIGSPGLGVLYHNIRSVMQAYPGLTDPGLRAEINAAIVRICEEQGVALLTEYEVSQWWEPEPAPGTESPGRILPPGWPR